MLHQKQKKRDNSTESTRLVALFNNFQVVRTIELLRTFLDVQIISEKSVKLGTYVVFMKLLGLLGKPRSAFPASLSYHFGGFVHFPQVPALQYPVEIVQCRKLFGGRFWGRFGRLFIFHQITSYL